MLQRSLTRVENFLIKVPFATEWEVLPADRPKERDRPTGHVRPESEEGDGGGISNAIKASRKLSRSAVLQRGNTATQHFCGGTNYIADIKGPTRRQSPVRVNLIGWPNNAGEDRAFQYVKNKIHLS